MRFPKIFVVLLCGVMAVGMAHAEEPLGLHQNTAQNLWLEASPEKRLAIVREWQALTPTTRQPFPVFRDRVMGEIDKAYQDKKETAQK